MFKRGLGIIAALLVTVSVFSTNVSGAGIVKQPNTKKISVKGSDREKEEKLNAGTSFIKQDNPFKAKSSKSKKDNEKSSAIELKVSTSLVSMTESRVVEVEADFGYSPDLGKLEWTFGEKPFSEWKKYDSTTKSYTGSSFIVFSESPTVEGTTVKAKIQFELVYGTTDLSGRPLRTLYPALIDFYNLSVKDLSTGKIAEKEMRLNVYDSYHTYDELKPALDQIFAEANSNRYLNYEAIGKSVEGRDFHFVVLAKDKASVNKYLNDTVPLMLNNPKQLQEMLSKGKLDNYKIPIFLNNIHPDEAPGIDAQIDILRMLATKDAIEYKTLDKDNKETTVNLSVDNLLDNIIFVMNLTENPDGRYYNVRQNANGFDVNRDNGYQTQIESQILVQQIAKWNPVSFLDLHGFVKGFLLEPCTPPHDPNYEYDLLIDSMLEQAEAMGKAGITNTKYDSYVIPYKDYGYGWDDGAPAYTATYAMHHGALGHTIEMPELNQDSNNAVVYAILGSAKYVLDNKDKLFFNQLEYFKRGIEGIDSKEVDKLLVNAKGESIGRPRTERKSFFPEYYILPVDSKLQKNPMEVYKVVEYLLRNSVKVEKMSSSAVVDGTTYPEGTYVVNMHQAKRGYVNMVLYKGYDASDFEEMYAEIVMNFPALRGFDVYSTYASGILKANTEPVWKVTIPNTQVTGSSDQYVIRNSSNDVVKAVNKLLSQGKPVQIALTDGNSYKAGDYIVSKVDLQKIRKDFLLDVTGFDNAVKIMQLVQPKVFAAGSMESKFVLQQLGFKVVNNLSESNVIIDDSGNTKAVSHIKAGKAYIGLGSRALSLVKKNNLLPSFDYGIVGSYYEGLLKSKLTKDSLITSGYNEDEALYVVDGSYIKSVPSTSKVIAKVDSSSDFFIAGWMPNHNTIKGKTLAITDNSQGHRISLFANTLTNKAHPQNSFRLLANTIFNSASNIE